MKNLLLLLFIFFFHTVAAQNNVWSGFVQSVDMSAHAGKKFKLEAAAKADCKTDKSQCTLWTRIDKKDKSVGFFDNMNDRPIRNNEWNVYTIEGVVDEEVAGFHFGGLVFYEGTFYFDDFKLSILNEGVWENIEIANPSFENQKFEDAMITGWNQLGKDVGDTNSKFSSSVFKGKSFAGNSALKMEGEQFLDATKLFKKYEGKWAVELVDSLCENIPKKFSSTMDYTYELLEGGLGLKETTVGVEKYGDKELPFEGFAITTYHASLDAIYSIGYSEKSPPYIFKGKLEKDGGLFLTNQDIDGQSSNEVRHITLEWINEDEMMTMVKVTYPKIVLKYCYRSIRKK